MLLHSLFILLGVYVSADQFIGLGDPPNQKRISQLPQCSANGNAHI